MMEVIEFNKSVADADELRDLEQFVAQAGGRIKLITENRNGHGLSVTYQLFNQKGDEK